MGPTNIHSDFMSTMFFPNNFLGRRP